MARTIRAEAKRAKRGAFIALAACLLVGVAVSLYFSSRGEPDRVGTTHEKVDRGLVPELRDFMAIFDAGQPLLIPGSQTTVDTASSQAGFPIYRPQALGGSTPETWFSPATGEVGLRYGSDLVLLLTRWPAGKDPTETYSQQAQEWKAGYTTSIGGYPAWVVPADAHAPGEPPVSVVHVSIGGVDITLYGRMPMDDLVSLAGTLGP